MARPKKDELKDKIRHYAWQCFGKPNSAVDPIQYEPLLECEVVERTANRITVQVRVKTKWNDPSTAGPPRRFRITVKEVA